MRKGNHRSTFGRFLLRLSTVLLGAFLGGVVWVLLAGAAGMVSVAANPRDPSAGAWVIVLHLATPLGCVLGGALAEKMVARSAAGDADHPGPGQSEEDVPAS